MATPATRVTIRARGAKFSVCAGSGMFGTHITVRHFSTALAIKSLLKRDMDRSVRSAMIDALLMSEPPAVALIPVTRLQLVYWIELKPGWQNGDDPGTHGIVEDTKTAAYSKLKSAIPCSCEECQRLEHELLGRV